MTWYRHAIAYAELKWPRLAPHSRASLADALATVTPLLTRETGRRPPEGTVRAALYGHAFNPHQRRSRAPDPGTVGTLAWLERVSLPVSQLSDPHVIRTALDGLCTRLDGSPAAANTISRKRAVFHAALGYAVELGLLPANPVEKVRWHAPRAAVAVSPAAVASPAQVRAILAQVSRVRPELAAFFSCLYYAALRPEEAVAVRREDLILPAHGRGTIILTAACPRTGTAWTSTGGPHETRGLKHRPDGTIRVVPIPSVLVRALRRHQDAATAQRGHVQRSLKIFPPDASGNIRSNWPRRPTASAPSPDSKRTCGGHGADRAVRCTSSSSSTVTTSTSRRAPRPWTSQASPTPTPLPISRTRPPLGTAAASAASSLPTPGSQASWKPGSGGSVVRGKDAAGKLLALGHKDHHAGQRRFLENTSRRWPGGRGRHCSFTHRPTEPSICSRRMSA